MTACRAASLLLFVLALPLSARASHPDGNIHEECRKVGPLPDYDETTQQDFLNNYVALATTFSPIHGPIPHEPGHGAVGVELSVMPPLSCEKRFVLEHGKTEDTNMTPVIPRPRLSYAFPAIGTVVPYVGLGYVPPVKIAGTTNVVTSLEAGAGVPFGNVQVGARFHATLQKTVGEIATPFIESQPAFLDLYYASTFGFDLLGGYEIGPVTPFLAAGFTDVSTFFWVGDDNEVSNNRHPYFGTNFSAGVDGLVVSDRLRFGAELYAAPGGVRRPDKGDETLKPVSRYGRIYTARIRLGVEL